MNKIMIVLSHNDLKNSVYNKALIEISKEYKNIEIVDLYARYGENKINDIDEKLVNEDREKAINSDVIVYQFPFHWYTSPPMLDIWRTSVLGYNWAFGNKYMLEGKKNTLIYTAGSDESSYSKGGINLYESDEFIKRFITTSNYCKMKWLKHFKVLGTNTLKEDDIKKIKKDYRVWLEGLF